MRLLSPYSLVSRLKSVGALEIKIRSTNARDWSGLEFYICKGRTINDLGGGRGDFNAGVVFFPGQRVFFFFFPGQPADEFFRLLSWVFFSSRLLSWVCFSSGLLSWVFFPGRVAVEFFFPLLPAPPPPRSLMVRPLVKKTKNMLHFPGSKRLSSWCNCHFYTHLWGSNMEQLTFCCAWLGHPI